MLLVDDILCFPVRSILWVFREIHEAALQQMQDEPEEITQQLRRLYMQLETEAISEEEFAAAEKQLLDRLEEIEGSPPMPDEAEAVEASGSPGENPAHGHQD